MKIALNTGVCRGNGACVVAAPELFDYDDATGRAVVLEDHVPDRLADSARMARLHCPTLAINLHEGERQQAL